MKTNKLSKTINVFFLFLISIYCDGHNFYTKKVQSSDIIHWTQIGPGMSGYCENFFTHPTDNNTMFLSPDMFNSYGSWDGGESWKTIKDCDGSGLMMLRVTVMDFSRQNPDFGLSIDSGGRVYITDNKGKKWTECSKLSRCSALAVDPHNDKIWYAGGGDFWNVKFNHRTAASIAEPAKGYIYKYAKYNILYKTVNGGKTWRKIPMKRPCLEFGKIIIDPNNTNILTAATNYGVLISNDGGESWKQAKTKFFARDMYPVISPSGKLTLYAIKQVEYFASKSGKITYKGGIFKSEDNGATWTDITGNLAIDMTQIHNKNAQNKYYKTLAAWFDIDQKTVSKKYGTLPAKILSCFNRIVVNPKNPQIIYISQNTKHDNAFAPSDVWMTHDGGKHWIAAALVGKYWRNLPKSDRQYWQKRHNPLKINTKFGHMQKNMDRRDEIWGNRFLGITINGDVYICLDQQMLRSQDNGKTWQERDDYAISPGSRYYIGRGNSNLPGRFILTNTGIKGRYLFCSGEHGLWEADLKDSTLADYDNVAVKQIEGQLNPDGAHSIASVAVNPKNPDMIYYLTFRQEHRGEFRRSIDGGKTWETIGKPCVCPGNTSMEHIFQYSLIVDYDNPLNIYFVAIHKPIAEVSGQRNSKYLKKWGVYKSVDGGYTWKTANIGLPENTSVRRITIDPVDSSILYAACNKNGGLFISHDHGEHWSAMKIPSSIHAVNNVFVDKNNGRIYISCGTKSGELEAGGLWMSKNRGNSWKKILDMPYIWQCESSPLNPKILTAVCALQSGKNTLQLNPGAYLSLDGGKTWKKVNKNLGQPNTITDFKPDPYNQNIFWCALKGSGWSVGKMK